jgi:hypothetical protein
MSIVAQNVDGKLSLPSPLAPMLQQKAQDAEASFRQEEMMIDLLHCHYCCKSYNTSSTERKLFFDLIRILP